MIHALNIHLKYEPLINISPCSSLTFYILAYFIWCPFTVPWWYWWVLDLCIQLFSSTIDGCAGAGEMPQPYECLFLFQRTCIQLAHMVGSSQLPVTPTPGVEGLHRPCTHVACTNADMHIHMDFIKHYAIISIHMQLVIFKVLHALS